jgi:shikimate dehydrogenase
VQISGTTSYYAQLADPVAHVRFPGVLQPALDALGHDVAVVPMHVCAGGLAAVVAGMRHWQNLLGAGVTMPHKEAIAPLLDRTTRQASLVGAVNAVRRERDGSLVGENLDGHGFVQGLRDRDVDPAGLRALLVGAGGVGRAIAFALAEAGVSDLRIANRSAASAERLAREVAAAFPACATSSGAAEPADRDLVVNATSLGMRPDDALPVAAAALTSAMVVADVVMAPGGTPLVRAAEAAGARAMPGEGMLGTQVPLVLDFLGLAEPAARR